MAYLAPHRASLLPLSTPPQDRAELDPCLSFPSQHLAWKASAPAAPGKGVQGGPERGRQHPTQACSCLGFRALQAWIG